MHTHHAHCDTYFQCVFHFVDMFLYLLRKFLFLFSPKCALPLQRCRLFSFLYFVFSTFIFHGYIRIEYLYKRADDYGVLNIKAILPFYVANFRNSQTRIRGKNKYDKKGGKDCTYAANLFIIFFFFLEHLSPMKKWSLLQSHRLNANKNVHNIRKVWWFYFHCPRALHFIFYFFFIIIISYHPKIILYPKKKIRFSRKPFNADDVYIIIL